MRRVCILLILGMVAALLAGAVVANAASTTNPLPLVIEGNITAIVMASNTAAKVTVQPPAPVGSTVSRPPVTFIANQTTRIFKDGKAATVADLAIGDACRAQLIKNAEGSLVAQIVYATSVAPVTKTVKGVITEKTVGNAWGRTFKLSIPPVGAGPTVLMWFQVSDSTKIKVDGVVATYDKLAVGQSAEVSYAQPPPVLNPVVKPILAVSVSATNPVPPPAIHVTGRLIGLDLAKAVITVAPADATAAKAPVSLKITNDTKIDKFGPAPIAALFPATGAYPGDMVDVTGKAQTVGSVISMPVAVTVTVLPEVFTGIVAGKVVDANGVTGVLYMRPALTAGVSAAVPFRITTATKITRNGIVVTLAKLLPGDAAGIRYFQFRDSKTAAVVEAKSMSPIVGGK